MTLNQGIIAQDLKTDSWPAVTTLAELSYKALEVYSGPAGGNQQDDPDDLAPMETVTASILNIKELGFTSAETTRISA
jgi:hypothetical protein